MAEARSQAVEFIRKAREDSAIKKELDEAYRAGAKITLEQVAVIGAKAGFRFSSDEFRTSMQELIRQRFDAGELTLQDLVAADDPPMSSCASGCLSYTRTWHPDSPARTGIVFPRRKL